LSLEVARQAPVTILGTHGACIYHVVLYDWSFLKLNQFDFWVRGWDSRLFRDSSTPR
jgi:hypothetical protein